MMKFFQKEITITAKRRGFHLITKEVLDAFDDFRNIESGIFHLFIKHTSAGLSINENADFTVRTDFESFFNRLVPENEPYFEHTLEGPDDMPAHIKSSLVGSSLNIPITQGKLNLGTWQGIYLCEFRNHGGARELVVSAYGV